MSLLEAAVAETSVLAEEQGEVPALDLSVEQEYALLMGGRRSIRRIWLGKGLVLLEKAETALVAP